MISRGRPSISVEDITNSVSEYDIMSHYLGITNIPCLINSPLRADSKPSFGLYSPDGKAINYIDFSTREKGRSFSLLSKIWNTEIEDTLIKIKNDFKIKDKHSESNIKVSTCKSVPKVHFDKSKLYCRVRSWRKYDIEYWKSYGITQEWLQYAEVYPVSHKIIVKDNKKYIFGTDKYAYAYVEHKEGNTTIKLYQPFNKNGFKWINKHDNSVISLWTKVPKEGDKICICSSLKDALCLWINTGLPAIAVQGEAFKISDTAINQLKTRYTKVYIMFDNDAPGLKDGVKLEKETGFTNVVLPKFKGGKDISDYFKVLNNPNEFKNKVLELFK